MRKPPNNPGDDVLREHARKRLAQCLSNQYGGKGVIIPPERLTMEALRGIVESFIMREGTDYGAAELSLDEKVDSLLPQIVRGEVVIFFDEDTESVNLIPREEAEIA